MTGTLSLTWPPIYLSVDRDKFSVALVDGREISVPLAWYPRLLSASEDERAVWEISGGGHGIHWPLIDEDLSAEGPLHGAASGERP